MKSKKNAKGGESGRPNSYRKNLGFMQREFPVDVFRGWGDWRWQLRHRVVDPGALAGDVSARYPCAITPYYLSLADWHLPSDPIRIQCCPDSREVAEEDYDHDPFHEHGSTPVSGLVHRFPDRALIVATADCAVYCRHCTRKNTLRELGGHPSERRFAPMLDYIRSHREIREVLVSGGDPLLLEDALLDWLLGALHTIEHLEVIRLGTRVPVVLPMRVTDELARVLGGRRPLWINTQFNHPAEVTPEAVEACDRLLQLGIPVSNQAVLLKGVNDDLDTMRALCNKLQRNMVRPYYVFQCDPIPGISHFRTAPGVATRLARELRERVGGLAMPLFVADTPGAKGKTPL